MPTKVLLCDTPDGLAQLQYTLMKSGAALELEVVTDGFRAVEVAARTQPEIVVTEIGLEGLAGGELVRRLVATVPETSVICWTNAPSPLLAAEMLAAGPAARAFEDGGPEGRAPGTRGV